MAGGKKAWGDKLLAGGDESECITYGILVSYIDSNYTGTICRVW